jgi:hypothetical protein
VTRARALFAATAGAWLLPPGRPGIGVVIVSLLVAFAAAGGRRPTFAGAVLATLALFLCVVAALRDAQWVVLVSLAAAVVLASAAAAAGETWVRVGAGCIAVALRLADAPAEARSLELDTARVRRFAPAARGAFVGVVVVVPFGVLFWTADGAFAQLGSSLPHPSADAVPGRLLAFVLVLALVVGLVLARRHPPQYEVAPPEGPVAFAEWAIPLALLDALFLAFVLVQIAVLFGGNDRVLHTAGLTYAEYARQGFAQLLAAASLTLLVVAGATRYAGAGPTRRDRLVLRALLGVLCVLTLVVLASALRRLGLYEDAYGFTRPRLAAHGLGLWLALVFLLLLAAGSTSHGRWLPRTALVATGGSLLAFALANPDRMIAERNVARWEATGRIDVPYLRSLSADAVPALDRLPPGLRAAALTRIRRRVAEHEAWSSANLSRARARESLDTEPPLLR